MGNSYMTNASVYLIEALFGIYMMLILLRFLLQTVRADFHNPVSQFLVKATNPPLRPLRRVIPGIAGFDLAAIVLLLALQSLEIWLIHLASGFSVNFSGVLVLAVAKLIGLLLNVYLITILAQVILSWIGPHTYNPVVSLLYSLNEPIMRPARRILRPISGIDLSPIIVLIAIQLLKILLVAPITDFGRAIGYN